MRVHSNIGVNTSSFSKTARLLSAGAVLLTAGWLLASEATQEPRMVDLNVIAVDNHGQPVTDLTAAELKITDNGKAQTIAFFHHRDSGLSAPPALGPHEISNRTGSNVPRATVILFDLLNEKFGTRGMAANQLVKNLQSLESPEYVYLYCLDLNGRLVPLHGLPGPEEKPAAAGAPAWTRSAKNVMDQAMRALSGVRPVDDLDPTYRVQLTYNALDAMANELSRVPGRKTLVWVTDGIPIELGPNRSDTGDFVDFTPLLRGMSQAFDRAGVSIYPVRQVMMGSPDSMGGPGTTGIGSIATIDEFANLTGGRPDAGKDIGAAVRQALVDTRTSYQVGYYPPASNWDDKFHKLRIACTRKGVRIQSKTGYYAWEENPGTRAEQATDMLAKTSFDAAEIGIRGSVTRSTANAKAMHLEAHIDGRDLVMVQNGDTYTTELRLRLVGYAPDGRMQEGSVLPMDLHLTQAAEQKALHEGLGVQQDLMLGPEIEKVRLIVFDRGSGAVGSLTFPAHAE